MSKRLFAALLLLALFLQIFSAGLLFAWQRHALYRAQMERIASGRYAHKELSILSVHANEIKWVKPHEFVYRGFMYDVVSVAEVNGIFQIAALKDHREDKMRDALLQPEQDHAPVIPQSPTLKIIQAPYILPVITGIDAIASIVCLYNSEQEFIYFSPGVQIVTPPPEA